MQFHLVVQALIDLLQAAAAVEAFEVLPYPGRATDIAVFNGVGRTVRVYLEEADILQSNRKGGPYDHNLTIALELSAAETVGIDLDVIEDPEATDGERQAALQAADDANLLVNQSIDQLYELVFQIVLDNRNRNMGLSTVSNLWLEGFKKGAPAPTGAFVFNSAKVTVRCTVSEHVVGVDPLAAADDVVAVDINTNDAGYANTRVRV